MLLTLTSGLPRSRVARLDWPHLKGLALADPLFDQSAQVDAILGADVYGLLLREGLRQGPPGVPSAQLTTLGWVLMGHVAHEAFAPRDLSVSVHHAAITNSELSQMLHRFWEIEELPQRQVLSEDDARCETSFSVSHTRDSHGRYTVRLPRREDPQVQLKGNRKEALCQLLLSLERRLMRDPRLREKYAAFMSEYLSLGHIEAVPDVEVPRKDAYYLPHHAVFKSSDPESKIRVVFNASYRTATGWSLNDTLLSGPKLQSELWMILSRWRLCRYAFTSDIVKMLWQIRVDHDDTHLQRIL